MADQAQGNTQGATQQAKTKAKAKAKEAAQGVEEKASQVGQQAAHAAEKAQQKASEFGQQAAQMAASQADGRKNRVAEGVHAVGQALRLGAEDLRQRGQTQDTEYVERLAGQVERVSGYLERKNTREMMREVEHFARQNQALFMGGALALGVVGARFLKSSPQSEMEKARAEGFGTRAMTERTPEPEHDAVGRPEAPGYAPPRERTTSAMDKEAAGPRQA
jgi:hypothetical protein